MFEYLYDRLEEDSPLKDRLLTQYRMHKSIGSLISDVFYGGALKSPSTLSREHEMERFKQPIVWVYTDGAPDHEERRDRRSYFNPCEMKAIDRLLTQMEESCPSSPTSRKSVGVIAGYSAQAAKLNELLRPSDKDRWKKLDLQISTVDSFQGREVDYLVYSVVRSNPSGISGFLQDENRLNVALSRGKSLLAIVGDRRFISTGLRESNPLKKVLTYLEERKSSYYHLLKYGGDVAGTP